MVPFHGSVGKSQSIGALSSSSMLPQVKYLGLDRKYCYIHNIVPNTCVQCTCMGLGEWWHIALESSWKNHDISYIINNIKNTSIVLKSSGDPNSAEHQNKRG